jgi:integrase
MAYADIPAFIAKLREDDFIAAIALEFCILTATRSGEVYGARWSEIDIGAKVWTLPAGRMKAAREHRVPMSDRALAILEKLGKTRTGDYVFPSPRGGKPLSHVAMAKVMRRLGAEKATVHGFRSAFRDWAGNETHFPREVCEAALAHVAGDATERAYRRGDALEKRRALMDAWASYCEPRATSNVVPLVNMV